ncbi:unnamed protein product [Blepharisma stoltei]|uniref:Transmembrane protein n=1 Tax=Blepharisma stoltei TaxID=1481888 RepID=A0AAU9IH66_9CILI|nr:unnamed protein product [Blepharisma stoltei]
MARKCQRRRELSWCLISCRDAWVHREFTNVGFCMLMAGFGGSSWCYISKWSFVDFAWSIWRWRWGLMEFVILVIDAEFFILLCCCWCCGLLTMLLL